MSESSINILETCTGTEITPVSTCATYFIFIPTYPSLSSCTSVCAHPRRTSIPSPYIPAKLSFLMKREIAKYNQSWCSNLHRSDNLRMHPDSAFNRS